MTSSIPLPSLLSSPFSSYSSSSTTSQWKYDVFLSFRGEDTRNNFTDHLYHALVQNSIKTFKDDNDLERGEEISPALLEAIEESEIAILIFSENYASSTWCLDELTKILECKISKQQKVLPVFYKVEPSTVRHQKDSYKEALAKHEDKFKDDAKVQRWKTALKQATDLSGLHLKINEGEHEFIQKIVQEISTSLPNRFARHVAKYPVGIQSHVDYVINNLLCIEKNETHMIGIYGSGGIGKTTIANELWNRIAEKFKRCCFLADVRENSKQNQGLRQLQEKILSSILPNPLKVDDQYQGMELIKNKLCCQKILLIIDDVDELNQLEKLCGSCDWFGSGSRIIITTRDKNLLSKHGVGLNYPMKEMKGNEARQLFTHHAFKSIDKPIDDFAYLIEDALQYAGGLPLALEVIGSNLYGEDIHYWKSTLETYKRIPEKNIQEKLKISFDGLDDHTKKVFLDIACFFNGDEREYVTKILDNRGFVSHARIKKLNDKCLLMFYQCDGRQYLRMHDLLQDMGREIVRQESSEELNKRSRLYFHEDVLEVLKKNKGTEQIEGILIDLPQEVRKTQLSIEVFAKLKNLRIFINRNASFSGRWNYFSNELRVVDWFECPLEFLPSTFLGEKLTILKMQRSMIRDLDMRSLYENLTSIDFSGSEYLRKISDLSSCSNLEKLILDECESLVEVHNSVGYLDKLVELSFLGCSSLKNLPRSFKLRSLELLELKGCTSLEYFPEIEFEMKNLKSLWLESTVIRELPSSLIYLTGLEQFVLRWCKSLVHLPINIFQLDHLEEVEVFSCQKFVNFEKKVGQNGQSMPCTHEFLPLSPNLSLRKLSLSGSGITSIPPWVEKLVGLSHLDLADCEQLEKILQLPPNIEVLEAPRCIRLVEVHDSIGFLNKLVELRFEGCLSLRNLPRSFKLRSLNVLRLEGCTSLEYFPEIECEMKHLKCVQLHSTVIQELHSSITYLTGLKELNLRGCKNLVHLPIIIFQLESLWAVNIINCPNLKSFSLQNGQSMPCTQKNDISLSLRYLTLDGSGIVSLPLCIKELVGLHSLSLRHCKQLKEIPQLPPNLEVLDAFGCGLLESFPGVSTESLLGTTHLLSRIDLSECKKVLTNVENHMSKPLSHKECLWEKKSSCIIYPESEIPAWFNYCKKTISYGNSIEIEISRNADMYEHPILAVVLCLVASPLLNENSCITISINGQQISNDMWLRPSMDPHRVCLQYIIQNSIVSRSYMEGNNMRFTFGSDSKYEEAIFISAGVHLIYDDDEDDQLAKHVLLEDMGNQNVLQDSLEEPGKHIRSLYNHKDVREVLERYKGTEQTEGILIDLGWKGSEIPLDSKLLAKLKRLGRLRIKSDDTFFCGGLMNYLSNELRVLDCCNHPSEFLSFSFHGEELIVLKMSLSKLRDLGTGLQSKNLTSIECIRCTYLTKVSDLSCCPNLEKLILDGCDRLVEVHDSVGFLDKLVQLNFSYCYRLKKLPRTFKLRSLELLELQDCKSLEYFPEIECEMEHLKFLSLQYTILIQELPSSIRYLTGLQKLFMYGGESLVRLPINIFQLECLEIVHITNCPNFVNFGNEVGHNEQSLPRTQENEISSSMELLPLPPPELNNLSNFSSSLKSLDLSDSGIVSLPPWIEELVGLSHLNLSSCKQLEEILHLPPNIEKVLARRCSNLKSFLPESNKVLSSLRILNLSGSGIVSLSPCIEGFVGLSRLHLEYCEQLEKILQLPPNIEKVQAERCSNLKSFLQESNKFLLSLRILNLSHSGIVSLPPCIEGLVGLSHLHLEYCEQLEEILQLPPNIEQVDASGCRSLKRFHHVSTESSFGAPDLKWLLWINLSECNEVCVDVGNHAPDPLLIQERFREKDSSCIVYPGSRIPAWFKYRRETIFSYRKYSESMKIEIDHDESMCGQKVVALVLCIVVGPYNGVETVTFSINGHRIRVLDDYRLWTSKDPHRVWLQYIAGNSIAEMVSRSYGEGNKMRFKFECYLTKAILKSAGVHLIYGNDILIDPIQHSKRYRDDGEHDLDQPNWSPQQKRQFFEFF